MKSAGEGPSVAFHRSFYGGVKVEHPCSDPLHSPLPRGWAMATSVTPSNLWKMHILGAHPSDESDTLGGVDHAL